MPPMIERLRGLIESSDVHTSAWTNVPIHVERHRRDVSVLKTWESKRTLTHSIINDYGIAGGSAKCIGTLVDHDADLQIIWREAIDIRSTQLLQCPRMIWRDYRSDACYRREVLRNCLFVRTWREAHNAIFICAHHEASLIQYA